MPQTKEQKRRGAMERHWQDYLKYQTWKDAPGEMYANLFADKAMASRTDIRNLRRKLGMSEVSNDTAD